MAITTPSPPMATSPSMVNTRAMGLRITCSGSRPPRRGPRRGGREPEQVIRKPIARVLTIEGEVAMGGEGVVIAIDGARVVLNADVDQVSAADQVHARRAVPAM